MELAPVSQRGWCRHVAKPQLHPYKPTWLLPKHGGSPLSKSTGTRRAVLEVSASRLLGLGGSLDTGFARPSENGQHLCTSHPICGFLAEPMEQLCI